MKVLHIISGDLWAGAETQVFLLLDALNRETDCNVSALVLNQGELTNRLQQKSIKHHFIDETEGFFPLLSNALQVVRSEAPDIVVTHGYKETIIGGYLKCRLGSKLVTMFHGLGEVYTGLKKFKSRLLYSSQSLIAKKLADAVITVSETLAREFGFLGLKHQHTILNCAESHSGEVVPEKTIENPGVVVIGRLVPIKRIDIAIKSIAKLEDKPHLYIIGDGPERSSLEKITSDLELESKVHFLGFRTDVRELISQSAVLLLSSDHEGLPTVILEAASQAKPIVSSDLSGIKEAMAKFDNYPIEYGQPGDASSFATALTEALSAEPDEQLKLKISQEFGCFFTPEASAKQHLELYGDLLA